MLLRLASILLIASIHIVAAAGDKPEFAPPDILVTTEDPDETLRPYVGNPVEADDAVDETKLIRGLLMTRQLRCPGGYGLCSDGR